MSITARDDEDPLRPIKKLLDHLVQSLVVDRIESFPRNFAATLQRPTLRPCPS